MSNKITPSITSQKRTYIFVLSILAFTGFEFFYRASFLLIPVILYALIFFLREKISFGFNFMIVLIFSILSLLQILFGFNQNILLFFLTFIFFFGYLLFSNIVKFEFADIYDNLIFIISLISLFFFFITYNEKLLDFFINNVAIYFSPLYLDSNVDNLSSSYVSTNILIYNFKNFAFSYNRNSGPFWEPGMFAVFLNIAFFFNLIKFKKLFSFKNIIYILTIITTFSTTGYLGMLFIFISYNIFYSTSKLRLLYILILLFSSFYLLELDFMQSKIESQILSANIDGASRFGAILIHLQIITDYPFIGVGEGISQYMIKYTDAESTPNGISLVFVKYGIPIGIFYYVLLLKSCKNIVRHLAPKPNKYLGYCLFMLFLILAFSQDITIRHFYLFMIFWGLSFSLDYNRYNYKNQKIINYA